MSTADHNPDALKTWREKLTYLQEQEAIATDAAHKFQLCKQIAEAKEKIAELESEGPVTGRTPADHAPGESGVPHRFKPCAARPVRYAALGLCGLVAVVILFYAAGWILRPSLPRIVLMDTSDPDHVYDPQLLKERLTNADGWRQRLAGDERLRGNVEILPAVRVGEKYQGAEAIRDLRPELIILHRSTFARANMFDPTDERLKTFLRQVARDDTQFLIYSRYLGNQQEFLTAMSVATSLPTNRIHLLLFTAANPFTNKVDVQRFQDTVWKITQSLRGKHPAPLANTNVMQPAELEGRAKTVFIDESDGQRDWRGLRTMVDGGYGRWRSTTQQRLAVDVLPPGQTFDASALHGYRALILAIGPEGEAALSEHHVAAVKDFVRQWGAYSFSQPTPTISTMKPTSTKSSANTGSLSVGI